MDFTVFIVDDEEKMCRTLSELLSNQGFATMYTTEAVKVPDILGANKIDFIIMDINMPRLGGLDLLKMIKRMNTSIPIIMITGYPSIENAVLAMKYGAADFLTKPIDNKKLIEEIRKYASLDNSGGVRDASEKIIFESSVMERVVGEVKQVAPTRAPVLVTGESGTGKELVAELIHSLSPRSSEALIKVNCASIPETLLESELFGHEAGAFTDAKKARAGKFELAGRGTLFLDEIGDMSLSIQPKILRVLQDGEIQRLGSEKTIRVKPRIVAASNRDLQAMMEAGDFREDLFFRLSVVSVKLPPLRERKEDVLKLTDYFIAQFNETYEKQVYGITDQVKNILLRHSWPGNTRELKNCIERSIIFAAGDRIQESDLPSQYRQFDDAAITEGFNGLMNLLTREQIADALKRAGGVKYKAAEFLGITRRTLYNRMKSLGME